MTTDEIIAAIDSEISKLQQVRAHLSDYSDPTAQPTKRGPGRPKKIPAPDPVKKTGKRTLSDEARAKIASAQKRRWAAQKKSTAA